MVNSLASPPPLASVLLAWDFPLLVGLTLALCLAGRVELIAIDVTVAPQAGPTDVEDYLPFDDPADLISFSLSERRRNLTTTLSRPRGLPSHENTFHGTLYGQTQSQITSSLATDSTPNIIGNTRNGNITSISVTDTSSSNVIYSRNEADKSADAQESEANSSNMTTKTTASNLTKLDWNLPDNESIGLVFTDSSAALRDNKTKGRPWSSAVTLSSSPSSAITAPTSTKAENSSSERPRPNTIFKLPSVPPSPTTLKTPQNDAVTSPETTWPYKPTNTMKGPLTSTLGKSLGQVPVPTTVPAQTKTPVTVYNARSTAYAPEPEATIAMAEKESSGNPRERSKSGERGRETTPSGGKEGGESRSKAGAQQEATGSGQDSGGGARERDRAQAGTGTTAAAGAGARKIPTRAPSTVPSHATHHLAKHFTGFVQHVWLPNSTPRPPGPIDDGPFGSILWRDKKYLISVLIPIGVGFAGAMMIIVMAYASRAWRRRKERIEQEQGGTPRSFLEAATSKNEDMAPLQESSDDEF